MSRCAPESSLCYIPIATDTRVRFLQFEVEEHVYEDVPAEQAFPVPLQRTGFGLGLEVDREATAPPPESPLQPAPWSELELASHGE